MKSSTLFLLFIACAVSAKDKVVHNAIPCINIPHTDEVTECMIDLAESKEKKYTKEFNSYLESINTPEERPYDKLIIANLAKKAKENWEVYTKNECLAEASVYEKGSYGFNDTYNDCLIKHYNERIDYYKKNKF